MAFAVGGGRAVSNINVTPLVDVLLVLLIIFMVTAPLIEEGKDQKRDAKREKIVLPRALGKSELEKKPQRVILEVTQDKIIYITNREEPVGDCSQAEKDDYKECLKEFTDKLKFNEKIKEDREVYLKGDKKIPYRFIIEILKVMQKLNIERLGIVTDPPKDLE